MKSLQLLLLVATLATFAMAGFNLANLLPNQVNPSEENIKTLYGVYMNKLQQNVWMTNTDERYNLFKTNVLEILAHNNNPSATYKRAINKFAGMFIEEVTGKFIMEAQDCMATSNIALPALAFPTETIPGDAKDWRDSGIISPVKDQSYCGACWAFAATGALEAYWALYSQTSPNLLSEQQLIDCSKSYSNDGCNGGLPAQTFEYITHQGGLDTENDYPYEGQQDVCRYSSDTIGAKVFHGSMNISAGDEATIYNVVSTVGPVTIAFDVTADFLSYDSGVYTSTECTSTASSVNHAVLVVGYGTDPATGMDYWLAKNSWGRVWGQDGYFMIQRGVNMCGLAECASYPNMNQ
jgi:cathepsin H